MELALVISFLADAFSKSKEMIIISMYLGSNRILRSACVSSVCAAQLHY